MSQTVQDSHTNSETDDVTIDDIRERYKLFVTNGSNRSVAYELNFVTENGFDKPIIYNTGKDTLFHTISTAVGEDNAIIPCDAFFKSIAFGYHQVMSLQAYEHPKRQMKTVDEVISLYYQNDAGIIQVSDQARWAIHLIVSHFVRDDEVMYEFGPIVQYTKTITQWETPDVKPKNKS